MQDQKQRVPTARRHPERWRARLLADIWHPRMLIVVPLVMIVIALGLVQSVLADVGAPPPPDVDAAAWLQALYAAVMSKSWGLVVGIGLIGLVYPLRRFGPNIFKSKLGGLILACLVSLAGTFGVAFLAGAPMSINLVIAALTTAATAAGLWEWIKAHLPGAQGLASKAAEPATADLPGVRVV